MIMEMRVFNPENIIFDSGKQNFIAIVLKNWKNSMEDWTKLE